MRLFPLVALLVSLDCLGDGEIYIPYASYEHAFDAIRENAGSDLKRFMDLEMMATVIDLEGDSYDLWMFTTPGHVSHPAVVRRIYTADRRGTIWLKTAVLCEASKDACEHFCSMYQRDAGVTGCEGYPIQWRQYGILCPGTSPVCKELDNYIQVVPADKID